MLGAYIAYTIARFVGFWPGLILAPFVVGALGALFERLCLRRVHKFGHVPELLITFGLSFVIFELVILTWGRIGVEFLPPPSLRGSAFTIINSSLTGLHLVVGAAPAAMCAASDPTVHIACSQFPATRAFMRHRSDFTYRIRAVPDVPPVLKFIQTEALLSDRDAYGTFNMISR